MRYEVRRMRTHFATVGYALRLYHADGRPAAFHLPYAHPYAVRDAVWINSEPLHFYGDDGRKVRAEAVAFAKAHIREHYASA